MLTPNTLKIIQLFFKIKRDTIFSDRQTMGNQHQNNISMIITIYTISIILLLLGIANHTINDTAS